MNLTRNPLTPPVLALLLALPASSGSSRPPEAAAEVLVYGATPGGIAAALAAASSGDPVLLIEPTERIGGMITNGLSHADFRIRTFEGLSGAYLELTRRVRAYYEKRYGKDSPEVERCFRGTHAEPRVNLDIIERHLAEKPGIRVLRRHRLDVALENVGERGGDGDGNGDTRKGAGRRIAAVTLVGPSGKRLQVAAAVFIDASYEGDLMARAGAAYRIGRESREAHGESLAPEEADAEVQGYNFRLTMTRDPENRVRPDAPAGYRREDFLGVVPLLASGPIERVFCRKAEWLFFPW